MQDSTLDHIAAGDIASLDSSPPLGMLLFTCVTTRVITRGQHCVASRPSTECGELVGGDHRVDQTVML